MFAYVLAVLVPPVEMARQGRFISAFFTLWLCLSVFGWPVASAWAVIATRNHHIADSRWRSVARS